MTVGVVLVCALALTSCTSRSGFEARNLPQPCIADAVASEGVTAKLVIAVARPLRVQSRVRWVTVVERTGRRTLAPPGPPPHSGVLSFAPRAARYGLPINLHHQTREPRHHERCAARHQK